MNSFEKWLVNDWGNEIVPIVLYSLTKDQQVIVFSLIESSESDRGSWGTLTLQQLFSSIYVSLKRKDFQRRYIWEGLLPLLTIRDCSTLASSFTLVLSTSTLNSFVEIISEKSSSESHNVNRTGRRPKVQVKHSLFLCA